MPGIKLANGTAVKDVRVWDGTRLVSRICKVYIDGQWVEFFRPIATFEDDSATLKGASRRSTTAIISNGFRFDTKVRYTVKQV